MRLGMCKQEAVPRCPIPEDNPLNSTRVMRRCLSHALQRSYTPIHALLSASRAMVLSLETSWLAHHTTLSSLLSILFIYALFYAVRSHRRSVVRNLHRGLWRKRNANYIMHLVRFKIYRFTRLQEATNFAVQMAFGFGPYHSSLWKGAKRTNIAAFPGTDQ